MKDVYQGALPRSTPVEEKGRIREKSGVAMGFSACSPHGELWIQGGLAEFSQIGPIWLGHYEQSFLHHSWESSEKDMTMGKVAF